MKNSVSKKLGVLVVFFSLTVDSFEVKANAWGYYMKEEICGDDLSQWRCRPTTDWCQVSSQTSCPEFEG